jgi:acyl-CoA reductase-like NAD-dependent aldehyde dehydrogenase
MLPHHRLFIGGEWVDGAERERFPTTNPYTRAPWATVAQAAPADVASAIAAARRAFETSWCPPNGTHHSSTT